MTAARVHIERLMASPLTIPILTALAVLSLLLSTFTFVRYANAQAEQERANCEEANALRSDIADSSLAVESLIRSVLDIVLRPGEGDAERQLAVRNIYDRLDKEFARFDAAVASIDTPVDCKE